MPRWPLEPPSHLGHLADVDTSSVSDGEFLIFDEASGLWIPGPGGGGGGGGGNASYAETIGDGTNTVYVVAHSLGTTDLIVQLWDLGGADPLEATSDADTIEATDPDEITVTFPASIGADSYRVVIVADGGDSGGDGSGFFEGRAKPDGGSAFYVLPGVNMQAIKFTATLGAVNVLRYAPLIVREPLHVEALAMEVITGTGVGRACWIGLYEADFDLQPGALIGSGEVDAVSTGVKTTVIDETIPPGRYLTAIHNNNTNPQYRHARASISSLETGTNNVIGGLQIVTTYGALTDPGTKWDSILAASDGQRHAVFLDVSEP